MTKEVASVMMKPVRLSIPASGTALDTPPSGSAISVGIIRGKRGPLVAIAMHDSAGTMVSGLLNDLEFSAFAHLLMAAGEECAVGAPDAVQAETLHEH